MAQRRGIFRSLIHGVRVVNHRYRKPKIEMTPLVRASLLVLRLYLILLVGLMIFKFTVAAHG